jgi:hypothetical protein
MTAPAVATRSVRPTGSRTAAVSVLAVGAFAVGIWLATGVSARDVAVFLGFQLAFVFAPGVVLYWALSSKPGDVLRQVAVGGGVGYALSILAYAAAAAVGARDAFLAYPALVLIPAALVGARRHGFRMPTGLAPGASTRSVVLAVIAVLVLVYMTAGLFGPAPLPDRVDSATYYVDLIWGVSLAAEALHHFPIGDPTVAGEPFKYHTFVFLHMASVAQVTGIDLTTIALRLWPVPALLLVTLQFAFAGRRLTGLRWAGPLTAGVFLLVGDLDLGAERAYPLAGVMFSDLLLSPTFLLGLVCFMPLIVLLQERLTPSGAPARDAPPEWVLVVVLLGGCAGAKGTILPVVLGGLVLFGAWRWFSARRLGPGLVPALGLTLGVLIVAYLLLYRGGSSGLELGPLRSGVVTYAGQAFAPQAGAGLGSKVLLYPVGTVVTVITLMLALVGLAWALRRPTRLDETRAWLLALLLTSVGAFFLLDHPGVGQAYFLWYGFAAGVILSAGGLVEAFGSARGLSSRLRVAVAVGACVVAVLLLIDIRSGGSRLGPTVQALLLFAGVCLLVCFALGRVRTPPGGVAVLAVAGGILLAGAIDGPLSLFPEAIKRWADPDRLVYDQESPPTRLGITRELVSGLRWVRDNTPDDAVLAVNNHYSDQTTRDARYFYYSALAERRVFIEAWGYTNRANQIGLAQVRNGTVPYPRRLALNDAALAGDRRALSRLADKGIDYALVDKVHGALPRRPLGRLVFSNPALDVYELS